MISIKLARKIEENMSSFEDYDHAAIFAMYCVDIMTNTRYIKSESFDDEAYQGYLSSKKYDRFSAWMNKGIMREEISGPFKDKMLFKQDCDWAHTSRVFLYLLDKHFQKALRNEKMFYEDAELMEYFKYLDDVNSI